MNEAKIKACPLQLFVDDKISEQKMSELLGTSREATATIAFTAWNLKLKANAFDALVKHGGKLVRSGDLSEMAIAQAQACRRLYADADGVAVVLSERAGDRQPDAAKTPEPSTLASANGSANPLTDYEKAQLEAALLLLRRRDTDLATKVLNANGRNAALALELQAYIAANSPNNVLDRNPANPK